MVNLFKSFFFFGQRHSELHAVVVPVPSVLLRRAAHFDSKSSSRVCYLFHESVKFTIPVKACHEVEVCQKATCTSGDMKTTRVELVS